MSFILQDITLKLVQLRLREPSVVFHARTSDASAKNLRSPAFFHFLKSQR